MVDLVIDTAFDACTTALLVNGEDIAKRQMIIGRGHAEHLVPMLEEMLASIDGHFSIDQVIISVGPGSFTGLRVGVAAARALGLAWGANVVGVSTTWPLMLAARKYHQQPIVVAHAADKDRVFTQSFTAEGVPLDKACIMDDATLVHHLVMLQAVCVGSASHRFVTSAGAISPYPEPRYMACAAQINPLPPQPLYLGSLYAQQAMM